MKSSELKSILKPLIKETLKEMLLEEDGILSHIIGETMKATGVPALLQEGKKAVSVTPIERDREFIKEIKGSKGAEEARAALDDQRRRLSEAIGKSAYGKLNGSIEALFEGTKPLSATAATGPSSKGGALSDVDPDDAGIDVSAFIDSSLVKKLAGIK